MMNRRDALKTALLAGASWATAPLAQISAQSPPAPETGGPFTLPPLTYATDSLEPFIDGLTMQIHHDKHHAAYVKNLNKAVADYPDLQKKSALELIRALVDVPEKIRTAVRNNGGGHVNHSFFWKLLQKNNGVPQNDLTLAITQTFGSLEGFEEKFKAAALAQFGSGWAWLSVTPTKTLVIEESANQDSPWMAGLNEPVLGIDVWEHAYYLKYQNRRVDYVTAFFNVINWEVAGANYTAAIKRAL